MKIKMIGRGKSMNMTKNEAKSIAKKIIKHAHKHGIPLKKKKKK